MAARSLALFTETGRWIFPPRWPVVRANNEIHPSARVGLLRRFHHALGKLAHAIRIVNTIYWAPMPLKPRSYYDRGVAVKPGVPGSGDLLIIPGPFGLRWRGRLTPRMEGGELASYDLPTAYRVKRWLLIRRRASAERSLSSFSLTALRSGTLRAPLLQGGLERLFTLLIVLRGAAAGTGTNSVTLPRGRCVRRYMPRLKPATAAENGLWGDASGTPIRADDLMKRAAPPRWNYPTTSAA